LSSSDLIPLLPIIAPAAAAVAILLIIGSGRNHTLAATLSLVGLAAGFLPLCKMSPMASTRVASLLTLDGYALFFAGLILAASFVVVLLSHGYLQRRERQPEEFYVLLLIATSGAVVLATSSHFVSFFLGLEDRLALHAHRLREDRPQRHRGRREVPDPRGRLRGVPALRHGADLRGVRDDGVLKDR
jgi:NADH-quinone oxidoreductase subunit N